MHRTLRILRSCVSFLAAVAVCLAAATQSLAQQAAETPKPAEGSMTEYMYSYIVVILGIVLGLLVVAKTSNRRDRERPAGYVEKNILAEK